MIGRPLTARQRAVLDFIRAHIASVGYPPSFLEIGKATGISSKNGVNDHLLALEKKGFIERDRGVSRGMRLTPKARALELERGAA